MVEDGQFLKGVPVRKDKCFVPLFLARDGDSGSVRSGSCEEIRSYEGISSYGLPILLSLPLSSLSLFFFSVVKFSVPHLRLCIAILFRWSGFIGLQSGFFFCCCCCSCCCFVVNITAS